MGINTELKKELVESFKSQFQPPFVGTVDEWAHKYVELYGGDFSVKGSFDISISKYLVEPFKELTNIETSQINIVGPIQIGKSLLYQLFLAYIVLNNPGSTLIITDIVDNAKKIVNKRIIPIFENCEPIRKLLEANKLHVNHDGVIFPSMPLEISSCKGSSLLQSTVQYLFLDEVWQYDDPAAVKKAKGRTSAVGKGKKIIITSVPNLENDQLDSENTGLSYIGGWRCRECGHAQPWHWSKQLDEKSNAGKLTPRGRFAGINWDHVWTSPDSSSYDIDKTASTTKLWCENCTASFVDNEENRRWLNDGFEYILEADNGDHAVKTFNPGIIFVNQKVTFKEKVVEYLQAKNAIDKRGDATLMRTFRREVLGKPWKADMGISQAQILTATFTPDDIWKEQVFKCLSVDYQRKLGMKFYTVVAFSQSEIRVLEHGFCQSWEDIDKMAKKYNISPPAVCVDSGYNASEVYLEAYNHGTLVNLGRKIERIGWTCFKGEDCDEGYVHKGPRGEKIIKYYSTITRPILPGNKLARLFCWANYPVKNILYWIKEGKSDMKLVLPKPDPEFDRQLSAETLQEVLDPKTALKKIRWVKVHDDNHWLDCMCQSIALCMMAGRFGEIPIKLSMTPVSGSISH